MRRTSWSSRLPWSRRPLDPDPNLQTPRKPSNGSVHKPRQPKPVLAAEPSAALRDQLLAEIAGLNHSDDLALWAHRRLPAKNTLTAEDARAVEAAYQAALDTHIVTPGQADQVPRPAPDLSSIRLRNDGTPVVDGSAADGQQLPTAERSRPCASRSGGGTRPIWHLSPRSPASSANARPAMRII